MASLIPSMAGMLTVVCMKWKDPGYRWNNRYVLTAAHVNRLYRAVHDNLRLPHRFVCMTDDPYGIDPGVHVLPVPMKHAELGMCYRRLWLFSREAGLHLGERFVSLDLDCVVTGDLTPLLDRPEPFIAWQGIGNTTPYCGSMFMMDAGAHPEVWEGFDPQRSPPLAKHYIGSDQAWFSHVLGPDMPVWTRADGIYSYRSHFSHGGLPGRALRMGKLADPPDDCRIVFFHGPWSPCMPAIRDAHRWVNSYWSEAA